jgi:hypothetical protein
MGIPSSSHGGKRQSLTKLIQILSSFYRFFHPMTEIQLAQVMFKIPRPLSITRALDLIQ